MGQLFNKDEEEDNGDIALIFGIAVSISVGACLRHLVAHTPLPYTVVVLVISAIIGVIDKNTGFLDKYSVFSVVNPHILLHIFLPILIFESAFSMEVHTFMRSIWQVLVLAVPGVLVSTVLLAVLSVLFFNYGWTWEEGLTFGSILSATDPVAVVALLREIGAPKQLTTLIEGESLLNDGSAIILFKVMIHIVECNVEASCGKTVPFLMRYFAMVVVVGPLFGYLMAKIALFCLSRIFNDAITEITITLATCYLTFYIGEVFLQVSGVISVVVLGVTMSSEHTSISPEVVEFLHRFWEVLVYIANTLIFTIVGMVIGTNLDLLSNEKDWFFLFALYIGLNVVRMAVLAAFMPILRKLGYGLSVSEMCVVVWGGLRGAVGLSLALVVVENDLLRNQFNMKVMLMVCGIVTLTLVINATTVKILLRILGMTDVSVARQIAMNNALNYLRQIRDKTLDSLKNDRFLADASWKHVDMSTEIGNPYKTNDDTAAEDLQMQEFRDLVDKDVISKREISEMGYEALLRMVKAEKYSYRRQFESGMLSAEGFHKLQECSEIAIDKKGYIDVNDINATWEVPQRLTNLSRGATRTFWLPDVLGGLLNLNGKNVPTIKQKQSTYDHDRRQFEEFFNSLLYTLTFHFLLLMSFVETGIGLAVQLSQRPNKLVLSYLKYYYYVQMVNGLWVGVFVVDVLMMMYIQGAQAYVFTRKRIPHPWHSFKLIIAIIAICDVITHLVLKPVMPEDHDINNAIDHTLLALKLLRAVRIALLFAAFLPLLLKITDKLINQRFRIGYDVARGFYRGKEDVIKIIDHIIDNQDIAEKIRTRAMNHQFDVIKGIGTLQRLHPAIALGVKTRQATRTVLNNLRDGISRLQEEGMLDTKEHTRLKNVQLKSNEIETKMKVLNLQTTAIKPPPMEEVLGGISWLQGNSSLLLYIVKRAQRKSFCCNDVIKELLLRNVGIYVIVSGMVLIETKKYDDDEEFTADFKSNGVLGEFNFLSRKAPLEIYSADTDVQVYHLPHDALVRMVQLFDGPDCPIIERMWMSVAIPIAERILLTQEKYMNNTAEEVKMQLTNNAYIADTEHLKVFDITSEMADLVLIVGTVYGLANETTYVGPAYIPWSASKLQINIDSKDEKDVDDVVVILIVPWQPADLRGIASSTTSFASGDTRRSVRRKHNISFGSIATAINLLSHLPHNKLASNMSAIQEEDRFYRDEEWHKRNSLQSNDDTTPLFTTTSETDHDLVEEVDEQTTQENV